MNSDPMACAAFLAHNWVYKQIKDELRGEVIDVSVGQGAFARRLESGKCTVLWIMPPRLKA